jgi:exodeoxyribonuclease VII small subunit
MMSRADDMDEGRTPFVVTEQTTFRQAYDVLSRHAQALREQTEPNIDDLLAIVRESMDAYRVCQARIKAVEHALRETLADARLDGDEGNAPGAVAPAARTSAPTFSERTSKVASSSDEDDIPF